MADRQIFLVPASNQQAYEHLVDTVVEGVPREAVASPPDEGEETVHVWGTKEKVAEQQSFDRGDVLLFYTGDKTYTQAAVVRETTFDEATARSLWGFDDTDATQDSEPWSHLLYLDPPVEVEIDGGKIADFADYGMDYVLGLQPLNEQGHEAIVDKYGGIPAFIAEHAVDRSPADVYDRSPLLEEYSEGAEAESASDSRSDSDEESVGGLPASARWQTRCERLTSLFDTHRQVVLRGPPHAVSVGQARRLAIATLSDHERDPAERIIAVSIDEETTYEDFVERPHSSVETSDSVTATDGPFKRACRLAQAAKNEAEYEGDPVPEFVLLVDAAPGVAIGDVLGQISHVLDPSTRRREPTLQLPHSGEALPVPANLNVLVVMERAAESLPRSISRRFRIVDLPVDLTLLSEIYGYESVSDARRAADVDDPPIQAATIAALDVINRRLDRPAGNISLGQDLFVDYSGEAADTDPGQYPSEALLDIWQYTAIPTLRAMLDGLDEQVDPSIEALRTDGFADGKREPRELLDTIRESATRSEASTD